MGDNNYPHLRIAFIVASFPKISETFIINQVADLLDRGLDVEVFTLNADDDRSDENISPRYKQYGMEKRTYQLQRQCSKWQKLIKATVVTFWLLFTRPMALFRLGKIISRDRLQWSSLIHTLIRVKPFTRKSFDVFHCHFGDVAVDFLTIKEVLKLNTPIVTSFYGIDVSAIVKERPPIFYDKLKREGSLFFVMSENMKRRVVALGFPPERVIVHPVSINIDSYPFVERTYSPDRPVEIVSVGRLVEKKGFDDLLHALALVKQQSKQSFHCRIIGGGPLEKTLRDLTDRLNLNDEVQFTGFMRIDEIINLFLSTDMMVMPSKTAANGDME
jgi:colanic acid/amylovoran biosynthesis glycosyltransferase